MKAYSSEGDAVSTESSTKLSFTLNPFFSRFKLPRSQPPAKGKCDRRIDANAMP